MKKNEHIDRKLTHMTFEQRESGFHHHIYDEELRQYEYVRNGDLRAVDEAARIFSSGTVGKVSEDPLRNKRYLFVAAVTLATRFAIEGGLPQETAYNLSDLFIRQMDLCQSKDEINSLHRDMFFEFASRVEDICCQPKYSKPVQTAIDNIYHHLYEPISVDDIAQRVGLTRSYFSVLFKREVGMPVSEFIREARIDEAKSMLRLTNHSLLEISSFLAFNSQSHFVSVFKSMTGMTPGAYRREHYRRGWSGEGETKECAEKASASLEQPEPACETPHNS